MSHEGYHEDTQRLSEKTQNMHRAIVSLQEELEAVDWYQQRADACTDASLKAILLHNMEEEIEHAAMALEWLRRNHAGFNENLRTYLFTTDPITEVEQSATGGDSAPEQTRAPRPGQGSGQTRTTIGSLRSKK
jgi:ferritin-like protein